MGDWPVLKRVLCAARKIVNKHATGRVEACDSIVGWRSLCVAGSK